MQDSRLKGKVAIVTGAASGIGRATANLFRKNGARVFEVDIRFRGAKANPGTLRFGADLTQAPEARDAVAECQKKLGCLDIVANCAGIEMKGNVVDLEEKDFDRVMQTNVKSIFLVSKYSVPAMLKGGRGGSIINLSSDLGISPIPGVDAYAASKGAIISLTKAMAKNWAKSGIRVNCIAPGPIDTPLLRRFQDEKSLEFVTGSLIPAGRLGTPEEVAQVAFF